MDKDEARALLDTEINRLRALPYSELRRYMDEEQLEVTGPSGTNYQVEVLAVWDSGKEGDLRLILSIDDGGLLSSFKPMTDGFVMAADGSFIGEQRPGVA
jgi:hypothetical protein